MILTAGALLLLLLTVLSGAITSKPINQFYYLSAAVTVPGQTSPDGMLHWTNYNYCGSENGRNVNCGSKHAAYGFAPARQLTDPSPAVPQTLVDHDSRSYITSRVYFSFLLIALFFTFIAMLACLAGFFGRLGSVIGLAAAFLAFAVTAVAASLMTVVYVRGRNYFRGAGITANLGVKLFAFVWTAVACLLLALLMFALGSCIPGEKSRSSRRRRTSSYQEKPLVQQDNESFVPVHTTAEPTYIVPVVDNEASMYTNDLPRSSYERTPRAEVAPPIDGLHTTTDRGYESTGTGAQYVR